jgi:hypothetical protein
VPARQLRDQAAADRRAAQRAERVAAGLAELQTWLRDQVTAGLTAAPEGGRPGAAQAQLAARMVDAQVPGVARKLLRLADLPGSGPDWPARLLAEYGLLHLLATAHSRLAALPSGLAAVVRSRVGYTTARTEVLTRPPVTDRWHVLAVRDLPDEPVPARRIWLRGRGTGRFATLLLFAPNGIFRIYADAALTPGTQVHGDLHFYPGQPPLRALVGMRRAAPEPAPAPAPAGDAAALLATWAAALAQDPWLSTWPALVSGTVTLTADRWHLVDHTGTALPLLNEDVNLWSLLAVSAGAPVTVAGEWTPDGLLPLTVWHHNQAVRL